MNDIFGGPSLEASLDDLKSIYRILVEHHDEYPELAGNTFLAALRTLLMEQAHSEGIDVDDDDQWHDWLYEPAPRESVAPPRELLN